jgi:hypothetical protein
MKSIYIAFCAALLVTACKPKEADNTDTTNKDTVVVHDTVTVKEEPKVVKEEKKPATPTTPPATEPKKKPWVDKMAQYHELRCRMHNGTSTTTDQVDRVVLLKDLNDIKNNLPKGDRFYFDADMVKAEDMGTCGK